jgi:hypothetical protein
MSSTPTLPPTPALPPAPRVTPELPPPAPRVTFELPPSSEWGQDPLFFAHVKLAVCEVVGEDAVLHPANGTNGSVHFYRGRPARKFEMMGYVVTFKMANTKTIFTGA